MNCRGGTTVGILQDIKTNGGLQTDVRDKFTGVTVEPWALNVFLKIGREIRKINDMGNHRSIVTVVANHHSVASGCC